jgi:hypothetical protein
MELDKYKEMCWSKRPAKTSKKSWQSWLAMNLFFFFFFFW